jgi:acetyl-CoA carboxylase carboxyltransferase component
MASITTDAVTTAGTFLSEPSTTAFSLGVSRSQAIGATSANVVLTPTCRFVSIKCIGGNHCHFAVGVGTQTATADSHYLKTGERFIIAVPPNANIAVIQGGGAATTLYISELLD